MQIDGCDDTHIALAPLAAAIGDLVFEELESIETQFMLGDLESFLEDVGGLVLNKKEVAMCFVLTDLLHDAKVVYGAEEVTPREVGFRLGRQLVDGVSELVDLGGGLFRSFWNVKLGRYWKLLIYAI
jgi:hypothetical protein